MAMDFIIHYLFEINNKGNTSSIHGCIVLKKSNWGHKGILRHADFIDLFREVAGDV